MGKIAVLLLIALLASCTTTNSFLIYNDTDENVSVTVTYDVENPDNTEKFVLSSKKSEFWMYEKSSFGPNTFYPQIKSIQIVSNKKCKLSLERNQLEKIVIREKGEWQWSLDIDEVLMNTCK